MFEHKEIRFISNIEDICWLAGLFEGEACFGYYSGKLTISIQMTDEDIIAKVSSLVDVPYSKVVRDNVKHKPCYCLTIRSAKAAYMMKLILPFMGIRRSSKINEVLVIYDEAIEKRISGLKARRKITDEVLIEVWSSRGDSSLRCIARKYDICHETLRRRLKSLGIYSS